MTVSSSSETTKLVVTAVGAAVAGAALALAAVKWSNTNSSGSSGISSSSTESLRKRPSRSYIFEDATSDPPEGDSRTVLFPHNHEEKMRKRVAARVAVEEDNSVPRNSVTVRVPATSANVGPGCKWQPTKRKNDLSRGGNWKSTAFFVRFELALCF
jgi:homoserine kinase